MTPQPGPDVAQRLPAPTPRGVPLDGGNAHGLPMASPRGGDTAARVADLVRRWESESRTRHVERRPARPAVEAPWPSWAEPELVRRWGEAGVRRPWQHQARAAELAWAGRHVTISTGTASGKSLAYQLPMLTAVRAGQRDLSGRAATALYLAPTKALAADQLAQLDRLGRDVARVACYDGDASPEERRWARDHAAVVLTNPDMLHAAMLPGHARWARFLRRVRFVVVDESHHYRGLFGSHTAAVLRRLRRVLAHYGAEPTFVLASATEADPAATARQLTGLDVEVVAEETGPAGPLSFLLRDPLDDAADRMEASTGAGVPAAGAGIDILGGGRRTAFEETSQLLASLVACGARTLAFTGSRRSAEAVALRARELLADAGSDLGARVASYRGGYLPEDRRALEARLRRGDLLGLASTNALELGIDISGLDAVIVNGWPGRRASLWQQAGRAGRGGMPATAVFVAREDPLDAYVVRHPEVVFGQPVEATVLDPGNPYVLAPQLCCAAAELPLRAGEPATFAPGAQDVVEALVAGQVLRARRDGWYWTRHEPPHPGMGLRGEAGEPVRVVEEDTGRLLGTVDAASALHAVHPGAVHLHQGMPFLVRNLDLETRVACVERTDGEISTQARTVSDIRVVEVTATREWGPARLHLGAVDLSSTVTSYLRRDARTGQVLGAVPLQLPTTTLRTVAVWWTAPDDLLHGAGVPAESLPGAAHAAEHAAIGMLPLVASNDRWDVGGVSTALHPDTGLPTVFVHDGAAGGAGFAERGFHAAATWLAATRERIAECRCPTGCPACVQSPKCGNGNEPLDKDGAVRLLDIVLARATPDATPGDDSGGAR